MGSGSALLAPPCIASTMAEFTKFFTRNAFTTSTIQYLLGIPTGYSRLACTGMHAIGSLSPHCTRKLIDNAENAFAQSTVETNACNTLIRKRRKCSTVQRFQAAEKLLSSRNNAKKLNKFATCSFGEVLCQCSAFLIIRHGAACWRFIITDEIHASSRIQVSRRAIFQH